MFSSEPPEEWWANAGQRPMAAASQTSRRAKLGNIQPPDLGRMQAPLTYPHANVEITSHGLLLKPSKSAVPKTMVSGFRLVEGR